MKGHNRPYNTIDVFEAHGKQRTAKGLIPYGQSAQSNVIYEFLACMIIRSALTSTRVQDKNLPTTKPDP